MVITSHFPVVPRFWLLDRPVSICLVFTADTLLARARTAPPDLVILPPGSVSADELARLRALLPASALVLLAACSENEAALEPLRAGFDAVVSAHQLERDIEHLLAERAAARDAGDQPSRKSSAASPYLLSQR